MMPMDFVSYVVCENCGADYSIHVLVTAAIGGPVFEFMPLIECDECLLPIGDVSIMEQIKGKWVAIHEDYEYQIDVYGNDPNIC